VTAPQLALDLSPWSTGVVPDRSGLAAYVIIIRSPNDPDRLSREHRPAEERGAVSTRRITEMRKRKNADPPAIQATLLALLREHGEQTFNALAVRGWRCTADILFGGVHEEVLWELVAEGAVEFTLTAPVLFRLVSGHRSESGVPNPAPPQERSPRKAAKRRGAKGEGRTPTGFTPLEPESGGRPRKRGRSSR
jgi:hypothetical protein